MKKTTTFLLMVLVFAASLFAAGQSEVKREITLLATVTDSPEVLYAIEQFNSDYPDIEVIALTVDTSTGSGLTMKAKLAAGEVPNVYADYIGRVSEYLRADFAMDLTGKVRDLGQYNDGVLVPYTRDGRILGLPQPAGAQGIAVNLDILDEIGFSLKFDWTVDEFLRMCELVKQRYNGEKFGTGMFAGNMSGDYLINNWFAAFGVEMYKSGDYSRTTVRETNIERVYEFFQGLVKSEYIPPNAATLVDDDYVLQWVMGKIVATAFFPGWVNYYFSVIINQGLKTGADSEYLENARAIYETAKKDNDDVTIQDLLDSGDIPAPFRYAFVPFPRGEGVQKVPTYISNAAIVVHETGTQQDVWAVRLAEYLNDSHAQTMMSANGVIPTRRDAQMLSTDVHVQETANIAMRNGIMDVGLTMTKYMATRAQHYPVLQKVLNLKITPLEAALEYEERINKALED